MKEAICRGISRDAHISQYTMGMVAAWLRSMHRNIYTSMLSLQNYHMNVKVAKKAIIEGRSGLHTVGKVVYPFGQTKGLQDYIACGLRWAAYGDAHSVRSIRGRIDENHLRSTKLVMWTHERVEK